MDGAVEVDLTFLFSFLFNDHIFIPCYKQFGYVGTNY